MALLRIMTWNIQLLPGIQDPGEPYRDRARAAAAALLGLPRAEQPDVIVFNEVFNDPARHALVQKLRPEWPVVVPRLHQGLQPGDSGLALFSRVPLLPLPALPDFRGTIIQSRVAFLPYERAVDADALSSKGVGLVLLDLPIGRVPVAFTHMQADYDAPEEHADVRDAQFGTIADLLTLVLGNTRSNWLWPILLGDLNIPGPIPPPPGSEWSRTFGMGATRLADVLRDGWRDYMRPPGAADPADPCFTNQDAKTGMLQRLDYIAVNRRPSPERSLVPQHMRVRFRSPSDHWSLEADLHLWSPHCTPSDAVVPVALDPGDSVTLRLNLATAGAVQWIYVRDPGSWSVFATQGVRAACFLTDDLSNELVTSRMGRAEEMADSDLAKRLERAGTSRESRVFAPTGPFFVRLDSGPGLAAPLVGPIECILLRHGGATKEEAIELLPWDRPSDVPFPDGKPLGARDECWFRTVLAAPYSGANYVTPFSLHNPSGIEAEINVVDDADRSLGTADGLGPRTVTVASAGGFPVWTIVRRRSLDQQGFTVMARPALTWLRSHPQPIALFCEDETGLDWAGSDEIQLRLRADGSGVPFFVDDWDDADAGEFRPLSGKVPEIAFVDQIEVEVEEDDLIPSAQGQNNAIIGQLGGSDPEAGKVILRVQSGRYRLEYSLSRR